MSKTATDLLRESYDDVIQGSIPDSDDPWHGYPWFENTRAALAKPAQPRDDAVFVVWWSDHMPNSTEADAWAEWCALRSNQPAAQTQEGWCNGCNPDNCGGCATPTAPAQVGVGAKLYTETQVQAMPRL